MLAATVKALEQLDAGESVDCSLVSGALRSSKDIYAYYDGVEGQPLPKDAKPAGYAIWHGISGHTEYFSRSAIIEVLEGRRDAWEGDLTER